MEAAAIAAWPYAMFCAWTYLNDHAAAHDIMDLAVENVSGYISRHADCSDKKLLSRTKSVIKRRAQQESAKRNREIQFGSLIDMEKLYIGQPEAEQRVYAIEIFERLSPFAQSIVSRRSLGYSWRKIAEDLEMDHTAVRRAYFREVESLLHDLSQPGELSQWI
jgi:DNA-binding NarL/FixJ family response regulator